MSLSKPVLSLPNGGERKNPYLLAVKLFMVRQAHRERLKLMALMPRRGTIGHQQFPFWREASSFRLGMPESSTRT
jgi:hypothetical protein